MRVKKEKKMSLEQLTEKAEILKNRIQAENEELKNIQTDIKLLSYEKLQNEIKEIGLELDELSVFADIKVKMDEAGISFGEVTELLDGLSSETSKNSETEDEKK